MRKIDRRELLFASGVSLLAVPRAFRQQIDEYIDAEMRTQRIPGLSLAGVIRLKASINGNHYGMARPIYHGPLLRGRNARYRVNAVSGNTFDITLTSGPGR